MEFKEQSKYNLNYCTCKQQRQESSLEFLIMSRHVGFPGGTVVRNPPANAGNTGPGPGKSRHAAEQLSPCATTTEARAPRARAPQQEKPPQ